MRSTEPATAGVCDRKMALRVVGGIDNDWLRPERLWPNSWSAQAHPTSKDCS